MRIAVKAVKDAREREHLFNEHMRERDRKEKEQRRIEVKKRKVAFRSLLEATKAIKVLTSDTHVAMQTILRQYQRSLTILAVLLKHVLFSGGLPMAQGPK